jgi:predicted RNA-binding protein YlxR (DUF448 family)
MNAMKHQPERTCIGCRGVFEKNEVVRIVAGPPGAVIDYRDKLPGRAAYVCPRQACIKKALSKNNLARALHIRVPSPRAEEFLSQLIANITERIRSLIVMSAKAGKLAAGYSAVQDALEKQRVEMLIFAEDLSEGTKEKVMVSNSASLRQATLFTRDEMGMMLGRELVGVVGIHEKGLADAVWKEVERLKGLINSKD